VRQEEVLRKAFSMGYFDFPRRIDSFELAKELKIAISTLSEILRAAERRVFPNICEYYESIMNNASQSIFESKPNFNLNKYV
jgi:predicted DNA binding protein